ncbi:hypothetical protein PUNSTDRAFT_87955 [Punctularia strigosozonata HHB-11173 SS5]|uniref:uncharacterized protein n=1 Tax=Punctularia strigosozonata (strain HHB-11173) TaxID=741275 RepID=UPI0004417D17|nr:uncharacterized protein PUNSTDRAFT_87955 [Punctularia strigosozonata HHB-11173 SS5]EIN08513.1 hypothetical protein PUNSTDRAFT_87955 [Punctularia strigosozonata HHB-11173 SS5]
MAKGRKANGAIATPDANKENRELLQVDTDAATSTAAAPASSASDKDVVKVNNANLTELKNACDDALKRFLSRPDLFKQIHTHTDVRLALGWGSVFTAAATGYYGWKVEFEKSKPLVWAGVILYVVLSAIQTLYAYFIERDIVFVGRRKTFEKRIVTDRITVTSSTATPRSTTTTASTANSPSYTVSLTLIQSSNGGKSLLGKHQVSVTAPFAEWFDEKGVMDVLAYETWLTSALARVMES